MPTEKQRREAERRRRQRQYQRRMQRAAAHRRTTLILSAVGVVVVLGLIIGFSLATGGEKSTNGAGSTGSPLPSASAPTSPASSPVASPSASRAPTYPCTWTKSGPAARTVKVPSTTTPPRTGKVAVSVATNRGPLTFTLDRAAAPCTVAGFVSLVAQHYYDNTPCHRLTTSGIYVLQCGDPLGTGAGGPGYTIPDEATGNENYPAGTIAMARTAEAHSGGSQFFIVYKDSPNLRQHLGQLQYTVFGTVTKGLPVIEQVAAAGVAGGGGDGKPKLPITLTTLAVAK